MRVYGVDFTSVPTSRKPIAVAVCCLDGDALTFERLERIASLPAFEASLSAPGPWIAGFDFPFTQSATFLHNIGWPLPWADHADAMAGMTRPAWRAALEAYKAPRADGDREHSRGFERGTGAASPQKLYGVPVALMHFEGVPTLRRSGVHVPGLLAGDRSRIAVEAYPGVAARALIGRASYKTETRAKQTTALHDARRNLLAALTGTPVRDRFGLTVTAPAWLADDPGADPLDALICAVQAAWAFRTIADMADPFPDRDLSEGWIADPAIIERLPRLAVQRVNPASAPGPR